MSDALLKKAIEIFNYPEDMGGEYAHDEAAALQELVVAARRDGFASLDEVADVISEYLPHRPRPKDTTGLAKNLRLGGGRQTD